MNERAVVVSGSFALPGARRQFGGSRVVDVVHVELVLRPDLRTKRLDGVCTTTVRAIDDGIENLELDALEMHIAAVSDGSGVLNFTERAGKLHIDLRTPIDAGDTACFTISYRVIRPRRGLFFSAPAAAAESDQCWTHGHAGGARYWLPCFDDPYQRATSATTIEAPYGSFALANGALVERFDDAERKLSVFRYAQAEPHAMYLLTMVVGTFAELVFDGARLPVRAYVSPDRIDDGFRTFAKTPAMIDTLATFAGVPYPYACYSQIAVRDFVYIGMENTTAISFMDDWLLSAGTLASPAVEALVVHELAHQWFGNLIATCEWTDVWLNEGFATYCEAIWVEADRGWSEYAYAIYRHTQTYFEEAEKRYTRPIVSDEFRDPIDLFDKHVYEKAGVLLHMLRGELGDAKFFRSIARYVRDNAGLRVEAIDFIRAIQRETGRNLRGFFDQWLRRSGHPQSTVAVRYDLTRGRLEIRTTQRLPDGEPPFRFTLNVGILQRLPALTETAGAQPLREERRVAIPIDSADVVYTIAADAAPALIRIDPGAFLLGEITLDVGVDFARAALAHDPDPVARIRAAVCLAADGSSLACDALAAALPTDPFWGTRVEIATLLGEMPEPAARAALRAALGDPDANVRRSVCNALGNARDRLAIEALRARLEREPAVEVIGAALHALGRTRNPALAPFLRAHCERSSWCDTIAGGALLGLAELGGADARAWLFEALGAALAARRQSAVVALAVLARERPEDRGLIVGRLSETLEDRDATTRLRAVHALRDIGDATAVPALDRLAAREPVGWVRSHADRAAQRLRKGVDALTATFKRGRP